MLETFIKYVVSELSVIAQAPVAFGLSLAVIGILVWRAMAWRYAGTIDSLDGRNKLQAEQIGDYKSKLSGATPDQARDRLDALEAVVKALSPRRLDENQKSKMTEVLTGFSGVVQIDQDMGAGDARGLASDFSMLFQRLGWGVTNASVMGISNPPATGIGLLVADSAALRPIESAMVRALGAVGIPFDIRSGLRTNLPAGNPLGLATMSSTPEADVGLLISSRLN